MDGIQDIPDAEPTRIDTGSLSSPGNPLYGYAIQGHTQDYNYSGTQGTEVPWSGVAGDEALTFNDTPHNSCQDFTASAVKSNNYPNSTSVTAEGDRAGGTVAGLGDVSKALPQRSRHTPST